MDKIFEILNDFNYATISLRLILAIFAGGIIGSERGKHGSAAGLRTHILVCIGSANAVDRMLETNFLGKQVYFLRRCRRLICFACKTQARHKSYAI